MSSVLVVLSVLAVTVVTSASGAGTKFTASMSGITQGSSYSVSKSPSSNLAQTDPSLLNRTDSTPVNVMIKYDFDATASYAGGVAGLAATSPSVTGKSLQDNSGAVSAYNSYTDARTALINTTLSAAVPGLQIRSGYQTVYGGIAAQVPANQIGTLLMVPGVTAIQRDTLSQPMDDDTAFIGAQTVWSQEGGSSEAGGHLVLGVLDTGVWPEHPMLSPTGIMDPPKPLSSYHCDFGNGTDTANLGPAFACNNKLVGAYAFTQTYMSVNGSDGHEFCDNATGQCSARDPEGHGTHTMTTAAGDCVQSAVLYGVERGPVCGVAPGAHVIEYRVCLALGCFGSDSVAAVQQAILDGVNVISFSISGGANPYTDPVELAFLDAWNAGIAVSAAAGNSGPGAGTSDHGGPWVMTVAASTGPRQFLSTLHLTADGGASYSQDGVTLTNGVSSPTPVVLAQNLPGEDVLCQSKLAPGTATGKVVACMRGTNARVDKGFNVLAGGAVGMILYNPTKMDQESDNHWLPAIHLDGPDTDFLNFINSHTNVMATFSQGTAAPGQADMMASFSSRGPQGDWIKPNVTAPGVQVLAGMTPQPDESTPTDGPPGNLYQAIAGTSMATPHAAGVALLVKDAHPEWSAAEILSAIEDTAITAVVKEDGVTPAGVFDMGSGRVAADRAVNPSLIFDESYENMVAAGTDSIHRTDLNIPSIDATTMSGSITTERTGINPTHKNLKMDVQITEPAGVTITVGNKNKPISFQKNGGQATFPITISAPTVASGQYEARINLVPEGGGNTVTIPVAFVKQQGSVTLSQTCSPTTLPAKGTTHCTVTAQNLGSVTANAQLTVQGLEKGNGLVYKNVGTPGSVIGSGDGVQWTGPLSPAVAPQVQSENNITGNGPAGGYLPLSLFGIAPISGVGDDTITNFNVPTFYFGGEPYSSVGVVSNGYLVIGGGDQTDVNFFPQTFPNAARPNNVIAPFWTDLNPAAAGGGAIRIGTLTDGSSTWLVVDWAAVKNFSNATTHSGEIWIRLATGAAGTGAPSEQLTVSYGTANAAAGDPGSAMNWGTENRDGSSGVNLPAAPANNSEYRPVLGGPTPGGQVSIPFDIQAKKAGNWTSIANLTSDQTAGQTQVEQPLTVTP